MKSNGTITAEVRAMLAEMVAEAEDLKNVAGGSVTDVVAGWLAPQYLLAARERLKSGDGGARFERLRTFLHDWTALRRGDHAAARLQLDREELEWQKANGQAQKERDFREWVKRPEIRKELVPELTRGLSPETLAKIERELRLL